MSFQCCGPVWEEGNIYHIFGEKNLNNTHWNFVETNVWHSTLEMRDRKILFHYRMNFEAFNNLILELTPFLQSSYLNPIMPQLEIKNIMAIVIY
jgi:hypothetical protein